MIENIITRLSYKKYTKLLDKHIQTLGMLHAHMKNNKPVLLTYKKTQQIIKIDKELIAEMLCLQNNLLKDFFDENTKTKQEEYFREELKTYEEIENKITKLLNLFCNNN